jgi:hypothetical protein
MFDLTLKLAIIKIIFKKCKSVIYFNQNAREILNFPRHIEKDKTSLMCEVCICIVFCHIHFITYEYEILHHVNVKLDF